MTASARMLTDGEFEAVCGRFHDPSKVRQAIRKFCEVNGISLGAASPAAAAEVPTWFDHSTLPARCIRPQCPTTCDGCNHALSGHDAAGNLIADLLDTFAVDEFGAAFEDGDSALVDRARAFLRDTGRSWGQVAASPVAPAGVPSLTDEQIDLLWQTARAAAMADPMGEPMRFRFARAVLSAGAPAVPLQDSVHVADNESTAVTEQAAVGDRARFTVDAPLDEAEFELRCNDEFAAAASGTRDRAWREIQHYAAQYERDGPIAIYEVTRRPVQRDGRGESTGRSVPSEAREAISSASGSDGPEISAAGMAQDAARYVKLRKASMWSGWWPQKLTNVLRDNRGTHAEFDAAVDALRAVPHQPTGERE